MTGNTLTLKKMRPPPPNDEVVPGVLQYDSINAYNSTSRAKMITQVQHKVPQWLRFVRYCYARPARLVIMHNGQVVQVIRSRHGSQQGDPIGGHLFALSIYDFMFDLIQQIPQAAISWIVDDLTISGNARELRQAMAFLQESGPEFGLFQQCGAGKECKV